MTTDSPCGPVERIVSLHTPGPWLVSTDPDEPEVVAELHTSGLAHFLIVPHPEYMGGLGDIAADARLVAAAPDLLRLLGLMFDAYENGVDCFEDPEDCAGYVGKAFRLSDGEFKEIADLLNKLEDAKALGVQANVELSCDPLAGRPTQTPG